MWFSALNRSPANADAGARSRRLKQAVRLLGHSVTVLNVAFELVHVERQRRDVERDGYCAGKIIQKIAQARITEIGGIQIEPARALTLDNTAKLERMPCGQSGRTKAGGGTFGNTAKIDA